MHSLLFDFVRLNAWCPALGRRKKNFSTFAHLIRSIWRIIFFHWFFLLESRILRDKSFGKCFEKYVRPTARCVQHSYTYNIQYSIATSNRQQPTTVAIEIHARPFNVSLFAFCLFSFLFTLFFFFFSHDMKFQWNSIIIFNIVSNERRTIAWKNWVTGLHRRHTPNGCIPIAEFEDNDKTMAPCKQPIFYCVCNLMPNDYVVN